MDHLSFHARVAYTDAQAPIIAATELGVNVTQPIVSGVAAAKFELGLAWRQVEFVMYDQNFVRVDLEKARQGSH